MAPASPSSTAAGAMSDAEAPTSPARGDEGKSFLSQAMTEDDDTRMMDGSPEPTEKTSGRGKKGSQARESGSQPVTGKIRHLKKEDGEPLWRKDIQYDFLRAIFDNEQAVFTNSYEPDKGPQNFADLYIDTMSRSSKTSKVLRDKLLSDRAAAKGMAMVCLLVNIGRMNTTLNCQSETAPAIANPKLTILQSSPRCEPSSEHTTLFPLSKRTKMRMPISSSKTLRD